MGLSLLTQLPSLDAFVEQLSSLLPPLRFHLRSLTQSHLLPSVRCRGIQNEIWRSLESQSKSSFSPFISAAPTSPAKGKKNLLYRKNIDFPAKWQEDWLPFEAGGGRWEELLWVLCQRSTSEFTKVMKTIWSRRLETLIWCVCPWKLWCGSVSLILE